MVRERVRERESVCVTKARDEKWKESYGRGDCELDGGNRSWSCMGRCIAEETIESRPHT